MRKLAEARPRSGSPPRHYAMWMFTAACPSRCTYCDIQSQQGKPGLTADDVQRIAHQILEAGFSEVMFAVGEPLLSPHLPAALEVFRGKIPSAVFSGGLPGLAERAVDVLGAGEVSRVVYSIDAGVPAENDLIRGRKGITRELLMLAELVQQRLPRIGRSVNTVVSRFNVGSLERLWERIRGLGLNSWSLTLAGDFFEGKPAHALIDIERLTEFYTKTVPALAARCREQRVELIVLPIPFPLLARQLPVASWAELDEALLLSVRKELELFTKGEFNRTFVERVGCPLVGIDVVIGVSGKVHPCSQAPIIQPEYVIGDLKSESLAEILDGEPLEKFAANMPHPPCRRCWAPSNIPRDTLTRLLREAAEA